MVEAAAASFSFLGDFLVNDLLLFLNAPLLLLDLHKCILRYQAVHKHYGGDLAYSSRTINLGDSVKLANVLVEMAVYDSQ